MTEAQRRYLRTEVLVSAAINAALSVAFVFLVFGRGPAVSAAALVADAPPQSFAIAFMATLVPTLLTRRRRRAGAVEPMADSRSQWPRAAALRALLAALVATAVAWACFRALLPLGPAAWPFGAVLAGKAAYGAMLGAVVGGLAARAALRD